LISILYRTDLRATFSSIAPIVQSKYSSEFHYFTRLDQLKKDKNKHLLIVRYFKGRYHLEQENIEILKRLKTKYHTVSYFDDSDGADSIHSELLPFLDFYYKSQMLKDTSLFKKTMYGRQLFSDFYHTHFNVNDSNLDIRLPISDAKELSKIKILWNLGVLHYPIPTLSYNCYNYLLPHINFPKLKIGYQKTKLSFSPTKEKTIHKIHARFGFAPYSNSIGFQRKFFLDTISGSDTFLSGRVNKRQYNDEMANITGVLSPYGWGEICFRDFESVINRSILIKPDMEHITTFPDIYVKDETYVPVKWDGSDLLDVSKNILSYSSNQLNTITNNSISKYRNDLSLLDSKVELLINDLTG
jgi:hypothetical protein